MTAIECAALLREWDHILLLTHLRPDGDTLGSAAALCSGLRRAGKDAWLFPNPEITERYAPFVAPYLGTATAGACTVSVDVAGPELFPEEFRGSVDLAIDHHPGDHDFAPRTLLDSAKASCGEVVLDVLEALNGGLTPEEASLLYIALSTDCGCFVYGNTRADTHRAAAHLIDCGADYHRLNKALFRSSGFARLKLEGMIFSSLQCYHAGAVSVALVTLDMMARSGATEDDCNDLASLAGRVRGSRVSLTVRELSPGKSKASLRTDGSVNATEVCARFGGGGHKMASGCTADLGPEELARQMLAVIDAVWPE